MCPTRFWIWSHASKRPLLTWDLSQSDLQSSLRYLGKPLLDFYPLIIPNPSLITLQTLKPPPCSQKKKREILEAPLFPSWYRSMSAPHHRHLFWALVSQAQQIFECGTWLHLSSKRRQNRYVRFLAHEHWGIFIWKKCKKRGITWKRGWTSRGQSWKYKWQQQQRI
jgi:hypothetical protein